MMLFHRHQFMIRPNMDMTFFRSSLFFKNRDNKNMIDYEYGNQVECVNLLNL